MHTEVNLRVIIDRHVDLFGGLSRSSVIGRWVIVGDDFHRFFDEFVSFLFQTLTVASFTSVGSATEIVIRGRR